MKINRVLRKYYSDLISNQSVPDFQFELRLTSLKNADSDRLLPKFIFNLSLVLGILFIFAGNFWIKSPLGSEIQQRAIESNLDQKIEQKIVLFNTIIEKSGIFKKRR